MKNGRPKIQCCYARVLVVVGVFWWALCCGSVAAAFDFHADSAHGNTSYGVNRTGTECPTGTPCPTGDCTHCHDTFDGSLCGVNELMLFETNTPAAQGDNFCLKCHRGDDLGYGTVANKPYSVNFGGYPTPYFEDIEAQFYDTLTGGSACGSKHGLAKIQNAIDNDAYEWGFSAEPNPCSACHNPHLAQRMGNTPYLPPYDPSKSPITRPSERYNNPTNLWGDDPSERMDQYVTQFTDGEYQAPYYYYTTTPTTYEPADNGTFDGSNLPDYVTFCLDCHQNAVGGRIAINYSQERHGGWPSNTCPGEFGEGTLKAPYSDFEDSNYVLSCLDCHEPHGARKRKHLIRRVINGEIVEDDTGSCDQYSDWAEICEKCHEFTNDHLSWGGCLGCHGVGQPEVEWHGGIFPSGVTVLCPEEPSF